MQDQNILKIINNLKGRKIYEQKKAAKLGFSSLYINESQEKVFKKKSNKNVVQKQEKKRCSCC